MKVVTKGGVEGVIESSFGKAGKFKVVFQKEHGLSKNDEFFIYFRRYVFDKEKKIQQDFIVCFYTILSILWIEKNIINLFQKKKSISFLML